jgi:hypothetical protein
MPVNYALRDAYGIRDLIQDTKLSFSGKGYEYRSFDSVGETTMVHPESAGRLARLMDGMRYERGGKGKYWIPKPAASNRSALLGGAGSSAGRTDSPARNAVQVAKLYGTTGEDEILLEIDEDDEKLFRDARRMEFGDYNVNLVYNLIWVLFALQANSV